MPVPRSQRRQRFSPEELVCTLSYYDLGAISGLEEFPRGSRSPAKVLLKTSARQLHPQARAKGKDDPFKVAFTHAIQLYLAARAFPVPALVGTRRDDNSLLQWSNNVYEIYQHVLGGRFNGDVEETFAAGEVLGKFHRLIRQYDPIPAECGSYHDYARIPVALTEIPARLAHVDDDAAGQEDQYPRIVPSITDAYAEAVHRVNEAGLTCSSSRLSTPTGTPATSCSAAAGWWRSSTTTPPAALPRDRRCQRHPAVQLHRRPRAAERMARPAGYLPRLWPFLRGYESEQKLLDQELAMVPWLMIEAVIAEAGAAHCRHRHDWPAQGLRLPADGGPQDRAGCPRNSPG